MTKINVYILGAKNVGKSSLFRSLSPIGSSEKRIGRSEIGDIHEISLEEGKDKELIYCVTSTWEKRYFRRIKNLTLTNETIFIIVLDTNRSVKDNKIRFWLRNLRRRVPEAKILPIITHIDVSETNRGLQRAKDKRKMETLFQKYGEKILPAIRVSNETGENIADVQNVLKEKLTNL
jgi:GTPase Era involved in 16S rRNA processing